MDLGQSFFDAPIFEPKEFTKPEAKGYTFIILSAVDAPAKSSGKPMLTITMDISEGEHAGAFEKYPKYFRQTYGDEASMGRLKAMLRDIKDDNPGVFVGNPFEGGKFNEQLLVGCKCGAVLRHNKENPDWLDVSYVTTIARAAEAPTQEKPTPAAPKDSQGDELPF